MLCDDPARIEDVLAQIGGHPGRYSEDSIKRLLKAGAVRDTDRRARFVLAVLSGVGRQASGHDFTHYNPPARTGTIEVLLSDG